MTKPTDEYAYDDDYELTLLDHSLRILVYVYHARTTYSADVREKAVVVRNVLHELRPVDRQVLTDLLAILDAVRQHHERGGTLPASIVPSLEKAMPELGQRVLDTVQPVVLQWAREARRLMLEADMKAVLTEMDARLQAKH